MNYTWELPGKPSENISAAVCDDDGSLRPGSIALFVNDADAVKFAEQKNSDEERNGSARRFIVRRFMDEAIIDDSALWLKVDLTQELTAPRDFVQPDGQKGTTYGIVERK